MERDALPQRKRTASAVLFPGSSASVGHGKPFCRRYYSRCSAGANGSRAGGRLAGTAVQPAGTVASNERPAGTRLAGVRTVYLGTSDFAVTVLERLAGSEHRPALVVTRPDRPRGRGRRLASPPAAAAARALGIDLIQPEGVNADDARE